MVATTFQYYTERLGYGLLVPRDNIKFRQVNARVESIEEAVKAPPLVITTKTDYDFIGAKSGQRSGLVSINGDMLKIKGCAMEPAFEVDGHYTVNHGTRYNDPEGGITRPDVMREVINTIILNKVLSRRRFQTVQEPAAIIHYDKMFKSSQMTHEEELLAVVMKVKGDTRFPEIYRRGVKSIDAAGMVTQRLGLMAGAQKRVTEDARILWSIDPDHGNAHIGNYIIFVDNDYLHLGMCDLESMANEFDELSPAEFSDACDREQNRLLGSLMASPVGFVDGIYRESEEEADRDLAKQDPFRPQFVTGFLAGYENPDKREPIPLELLCEDFDFNTLSLPLGVDIK